MRRRWFRWFFVGGKGRNSSGTVDGNESGMPQFIVFAKLGRRNMN